MLQSYSTELIAACGFDSQLCAGRVSQHTPYTLRIKQFSISNNCIRCCWCVEEHQVAIKVFAKHSIQNACTELGNGSKHTASLKKRNYLAWSVDFFHLRDPHETLNNFIIEKVTTTMIGIGFAPSTKKRQRFASTNLPPSHVIAMNAMMYVRGEGRGSLIIIIDNSEKSRVLLIELLHDLMVYFKNSLF